MGDKSDKNAFKAAFQGFATRAPARDMSPSAATDGSARGADETPVSKKEAADRLKKDQEWNKQFQADMSNNWPLTGRQRQGPVNRPNVAELSANLRTLESLSC